MKKLSFSIVFLFLFTCTFGQKIQLETVKFTEIRLPATPIGDNLQHYQFTVKSPYPENNNALIEEAKAKYEQEVANYPQVVAESEANHQRALAEYEEQVEMARENFRIESEQYNNLSMVERLALADQKPVLRLPSKPVYYKPAEPRYYEPNLTQSITYSPEVLAGYIRLDGYSKGSEDALIGTITLYDFEHLESQQNVQEKNVYNSKTKQTEVKRTYSYTTAYKRPTYVLLTFNDQTLYDGVFEGTGEYTNITTAQKPNLFNLEKQSVEDVLKDVNEYINNLYGLTPIEQTIKIGYVKNKDGEYDDLDKAKNAAMSGLKNLTIGEENESLEEAITIWESALTEVDLEDKKARIDAKVYEEILFNLTKVCLAAYYLEKAETYIETLRTVKLSGSEKAELERYENELLDRKQRAAANNL